MASAILYEIRREDNGSGEFVLIEHRRVMVQIDSQLLAPTHLAASSGTLVAGNSDDALSRGALYIFERAEAFANRQNSISTSPSPTAAVAFPLKPKKCSAQEGLAVAEEVVCVIDGDSRVHCWGRDSCGNLGLDDEKVRSVSTDSSQAVHLPARAVSVSVGGFMLREISLPFGGQACAVLIDGRLYCWGRPGSHVSEVKPEQVDIGNRVAVSTSGVYVLFNDGSFGRVFRYREDEPFTLTMHWNGTTEHGDEDSRVVHISSNFQVDVACGILASGGLVCGFIGRYTTGAGFDELLEQRTSRFLDKRMRFFRVNIDAGRRIHKVAVGSQRACVVLDNR